MSQEPAKPGGLERTAIHCCVNAHDWRKNRLVCDVIGSTSISPVIISQESFGSEHVNMVWSRHRFQALDRLQIPQAVLKTQMLGCESQRMTHSLKSC